MAAATSFVIAQQTARPYQPPFQSSQKAAADTGEPMEGQTLLQPNAASEDLLIARFACFASIQRAIFTLEETGITAFSDMAMSYDIELVRRAVGVEQEPPTVIFPTLRPRAKLSIVDEPGIFERLLGLLGIHERRTGETRVNGRPGKVQAREEGPSVEEPHDF
ncbi:hypothetical protein PCL_04203 [Purpureocillium lilacinum]|uniref:Uncharacterized protein n=1 Tax=Purpureocillium lilacinum TaxID=33203 RepID=A0A2U3ER88_PURLI|nr:hypothetical protein PCL_04203 [Purpureocillium lilacinum]